MLQSILHHRFDHWWQKCWMWKIFALLPLYWAKPVILSPCVLDSSVAFLLHVWDCLMWEHCPLLIPFCTLSEAPTNHADWHKACGMELLRCYRTISLRFDNFFVFPSALMSQVWCHFHVCFISERIMFRICCWYLCGLHKPKHVEKSHKTKFEWAT